VNFALEGKSLNRENVAQIAYRQGLNTVTTIALIALHLGAIGALFCFTWKAVAIAAVLYYLTIGLGISLGYHRLHTHRSYRVPLWIEYILATLGALTLEGGPIFWVATHRLHHQNSDQPDDPHSPRHGAFWSHLGWILWGQATHRNTALLSRYAPDLARHPYYVWLNNYHWIVVAILGVGLLVFGGWSVFLWGFCVRTIAGLHATWAVNSATHMWGKRRFATRDDSRNTWWVAIVSFGEGWHNNHHAHPTSARHGLAWYEFDPSWLLLRVLEFAGLASAIKVAEVGTPIPGRPEPMLEPVGELR
jgi:stearoyl-CoA desaturase (Delta-9 desaturase)